MNLQPTLQNDLLKLRPLVADDLEPLYNAANDPLIWDQHFDKRNERATYERFFHEGILSGGALTVVHKNAGSIIGTSRYHQFEDFPNAVEIGWTFLTREHWGGMYNRMMKQLMIKHAMKEVDSVYLMIDQNNFRSQKAATKIGGRMLSIEERASHPQTRNTNLVYVIEKADWKG